MASSEGQGALLHCRITTPCGMARRIAGAGIRGHTMNAFGTRDQMDESRARLLQAARAAGEPV